MLELDHAYLALPEIIILVTACTVLLADLFLNRLRNKATLYLSLLGLLGATGVATFLLGNFTTLLFNGLYISDDVSQLLKIFICISVFLSFWYSQDYLEQRNIPMGDYYTLGLFSTLGMMILVSAQSTLTVYLGLELLSLPIYALVALQRFANEPTEAAVKYFIMGAIASGMLLYGFSFLYGITGKLNFLDIANTVATNGENQNLLIAFAIVFITAGVGFKLASVPFHMWAPDVYEGAPTAVTLLLSTAPKIAAFGMALRIFNLGLNNFASQWQQLLLVMSLASIIVGNVMAVAQSNLKRLLAYSAIAHTGYILFGFLAGTPAGYAASIYYVIVYSLMTLAFFGFMVLLSRHGLEVKYISDLKGLNRNNPWLAFLLLIVLFSLAGVPPTVGFFVKLLVLKALVDVQLSWVAAIGLIFAVIGCYYYIRIVKVMYFEEPAPHSPSFQLDRVNMAVLSLNCIVLLILGIFPTGLISLSLNAFNS